MARRPRRPALGPLVAERRKARDPEEQLPVACSASALEACLKLELEPGLG